MLPLYQELKNINSLSRDKPSKGPFQDDISQILTCWSDRGGVKMALYLRFMIEISHFVYHSYVLLKWMPWNGKIMIMVCLNHNFNILCCIFIVIFGSSMTSAKGGTGDWDWDWDCRTGDVYSNKEKFGGHHWETFLVKPVNVIRSIGTFSYNVFVKTNNKHLTLKPRARGSLIHPYQLFSIKCCIRHAQWSDVGCFWHHFFYRRILF